MTVPGSSDSRDPPVFSVVLGTALCPVASAVRRSSLDFVQLSSCGGTAVAASNLLTCQTRNHSFWPLCCGKKKRTNIISENLSNCTAQLQYYQCVPKRISFLLPPTLSKSLNYILELHHFRNRHFSRSLNYEEHWKKKSARPVWQLNNPLAIP